MRRAAGLAVLCALAVACSAPGRGDDAPVAATAVNVEQAVRAREQRSPSVDDWPDPGRLRRVDCRRTGHLAGVGPTFFCDVEYDKVGTGYCAALDGDELYVCGSGHVTCTPLRRGDRGSSALNPFAFAGLALDDPRRMYRFACGDGGRLQILRIVFSSFDTRGGRLLEQPYSEFPDDGVALEIEQVSGGPVPTQGPETERPLDLADFGPAGDVRRTLGFRAGGTVYYADAYIGPEAEEQDVRALRALIASIRPRR